MTLNNKHCGSTHAFTVPGRRAKVQYFHRRRYWRTRVATPVDFLSQLTDTSITCKTPIVINKLQINVSK